MHVHVDAAGSNLLLSIMRQVTALVRRRGKFQTCGEHHFASVAQLAGGASLRRKTVRVRIPPDAPNPPNTEGGLAMSIMPTRVAPATGVIKCEVELSGAIKPIGISGAD